MGDPRRLKKKYTKPGHPWQKVRIEEEKKLLKEYGLKTKRELWKQETLVKSFAAQAKKLIALTDKQAEKEKEQLFDRLKRLGVLQGQPKLDDVLGLTTKDLLGRTLQYLVCRKGLARTVKQARQYITHQHICVGGRVVSSPSFLVPLALEESVAFRHASTLAAEDHPERAVIIKKKEQEPSSEDTTPQDKEVAHASS